MFGDEDHGHSVLGCLTLLNTALLVALLYALLSNGLIDLRSIPLPGPLSGLTSGASASDNSTDEIPTPGARATTTRTSLTVSPTPTGFKGGDAIRVRRGAEFRSSPDFKQPVFCKLTDELPATVIDQDPGKSVDSTGKQRLIYPVDVLDASCEGGAKVPDLKGWVSEDFLRR